MDVVSSSAMALAVAGAAGETERTAAAGIVSVETPTPASAPAPSTPPTARSKRRRPQLSPATRGPRPHQQKSSDETHSDQKNYDSSPDEWEKKDKGAKMAAALVELQGDPPQLDGGSMISNADLFAAGSGVPDLRAPGAGRVPAHQKVGQKRVLQSLLGGACAKAGPRTAPPAPSPVLQSLQGPYSSLPGEAARPAGDRFGKKMLLVDDSSFVFEKTKGSKMPIGETATAPSSDWGTGWTSSPRRAGWMPSTLSLIHI